ncbi:hypothetical protein Rleg2_4232 [Rhizobium leguminosarum bv. trifolii WSM2304]|uniref:DUF732 domain-containing protein n=1 Tax=Rhizobium leguminosarum bv. trifolii (strain WSM2304) TaxID=395492 RepID=A0ABF7QT99_RHILW|nr:hypothetical protein [Rhizobium leguminosarum]ACI57493.1 hypothetical protein Rleg2_4232 [Rhizobium leguminosarum bv. trifolii WSM2304]
MNKAVHDNGVQLPRFGDATNDISNMVMRTTLVFKGRSCMVRRLLLYGEHMRIIGTVCAAAAAMMGTAGFARADYKSNYSDWNQADQNSRFAYIQGLMDYMSNDMALGEPNWTTARRAGLMTCASELKVTPSMLETAISHHYATYATDWRFPPAVVFDRVMNVVCFDYINVERAKAGLPPWKALVGAINQQ